MNPQASTEKRRTKKHLLLYIFFLIVCSSGILFLKPFWKARDSSIIEHLSRQEKEDLTIFCQWLIKDTEFGFTLFGTKPISWIVECNDSFLNKNRLLVERSLPLFKHLVHKIHSKKYIFFFQDFDEIYFVNKQLLKQVILENKKIWDVQGISVGPYLAFKKGWHTLLQRNDALFGICLGYGVSNSLNFQRKVFLRDFFWIQGQPPWRTFSPLFTEEQEKFLSLDEKLPLYSTLTPLKKPSPSPGFSSLLEEIEYLRKVLQPHSHCLPSDIASVQIPQFLCDPTNQETITLLKNYKEQQKLLNEILASPDILKRIVEKLSEE